MSDEPISESSERPRGIPGSELAGPYGVGEYAAALRRKLRSFERVQLVGEIVNLRVAARGARVYFELRDSSGALACAVWREHWLRLGLAADAVEGAQVVVAGGCDYYPGTATSSPSFSFGVSDLRVAGAGDLLARIERLRRTLAADGLFEPQRALHRSLLPRSIGVVCGESSKAADDVLAGLARRGWSGRLVWGFAPVQDRHAAPRICAALRELVACGGVEVIVVARGGGSLVDLLAFCDETLCRTVALLPVPVIASVGHHTDRTLLDDVAAASCSTPTHAAEEAVPLHCAHARAEQTLLAARLREHGRRAVLERARTLSAMSRAPAAQVARQRTALHQRLRELRAAARRRIESERAHRLRDARGLVRKLDGARADCTARRPAELERLSLTLAAHDPARTLERGYALVEDDSGALVLSADAARAAGRFGLRFADGSIRARIEE
ncbi:MAG: exodeoxyribonuclease VII large subunit [Solirubrobacteraceae bacterium]